MSKLIIFNLIYDKYSKQSFNDIEMWLKELKTHANPDIKVFLIGNKIDLEESRLVTKEQALKFKEDFELDLFMETSAKTGFNTQELFVQAAKVLYDDYMKYKQKNKKPNERIKIEPKIVTQQESKGGCCHK